MEEALVSGIIPRGNIISSLGDQGKLPGGGDIYSRT